VKIERRIGLMKKSRISMMIIMVATLVCFLWMAGCAKKAVQQGDASGAPAAAVAAADQTPAATETAKAPTGGATKEVAAAKPEASGLEDIHFDFDKSVLRAADRYLLNLHAAWLLKNAAYNVLIEGHCDERGTTEYNLALGERRAKEAMQYLIGLGVEKERLKTISYGEERPLDPGHTEEAWAKNRRDHFVIKMK
jgi:peptidoglycan-associated lipoprotein